LTLRLSLSNKIYMPATILTRYESRETALRLLYRAFSESFYGPRCGGVMYQNRAQAILYREHLLLRSLRIIMSILSLWQHLPHLQEISRTVPLNTGHLLA
jgi:hypothetical protein